MAAHHLSFGYYPRPLEISAGAITITSIPGLAAVVESLQGRGDVEDHWIYAPISEVSYQDGGIKLKPYPDRVFDLPKTHLFSHASADNEEQIIFHLWVLSFFTGMRLTSTDAGFLDSTPTEPNKIFDFLLLGRGLIDAVELAENFWIEHRASPRRTKLVAAIVHALLLSKHPNHLQFERFSLLYSAFDACFSLARSIHGSAPDGHAKRASWLCKLFGIPTPDWADKQGTASPEVTDLRNNSVHEALFMNEPLGFALHGVGAGANLNAEMEALICRLLVALLGRNGGDYVTSPVSTYQRHGLDLRKLK